MPIQTVDPTINKTIKSFDEMSDETLETSLTNASLAFREWKKTSFEERSGLLRRVASAMREQRDILAKLMTLEMGKLITQAEGEIDLSAEIFEYYAANGERFLADRVLTPKEGQAFVRYSPIGVLLGIQPWNFPFYQVARFAAPNLMAGNTILLKLASSVPQCAIAIEELFRQAGARVGVYTNLLISGPRASLLVGDPRIKGVSLTGSEDAGASVAAEAGKNLKKSVLELGGNDAFIILEDADINHAVQWAVVGRMNNNGQCCVASKRFIAVESIADEFIEKFKQKLMELKVGDPLDRSTDLGPLSSESAAQHLAEQVRKSVEAGAKVLLGGNRVDRPGAFMEATILTNLNPANPAYNQELFGPVALFYRVKDEKAAIELANDSTYGLGGCVFTQNIERGKKVADQIDTGMFFINHPTWTAAELPFGGVKRSGYGRELSEFGMHEFVNKKLIRVSALTDPF